MLIEGGYVTNNCNDDKWTSESNKPYWSLYKRRLYKDLLVIQTLYLQQQELYDEKKQSVADRIVSISQPHIRQIVRGKASAKTEFGAKISISIVDGWSFVDIISFDVYNEGTELQEQINKYKKRFGY